MSPYNLEVYISMVRFRKFISLFLILITIATMAIGGSALLSVSAAGTGTGLAEHALNAYYSGWSYVYGAASVGAVDCSGLIYVFRFRQQMRYDGFIL